MSQLNRHIGLLPLIFYGIGDILGSGIYGLIGKVAGQMGNFVWLAFLTAFLVALATGISYAALGSRYPKAAGSSFVVWKATESPFLAFVIGLATMCSGLTSMAAASRIFSGYLNGLVAAIPVELGVLLFSLMLTAIVFVGIRQSLWVNTLCTLIELSGLLIIVVVGFSYLGKTDLLDVSSIPDQRSLSASLVLSGAVLAFYSFIGFEDILNVSEEVKEPKRNVPLALMISMTVASLIYMIIGIVAVSVLPADRLASSQQPLVDVVAEAWPGFPTWVFSVIALFAVANTALLNYLMASRLLYGLAKLNLLPGFLAKVHTKRKTPYWSITTVFVIMLCLAFFGEVSSLARATSLFVLLVFVAMNSSLILLKWKNKALKLKVPFLIPLAGVIGALAMAAFAKADDYKIAGIMLAGIIGLYWLNRPTAEQIDKFEQTAES